MFFQAAILRKSKQPLSVEQIEFRDLLAPGQVLVQIQRTAICGSQIGEISAVKGPDPYLPHLLGHEAIGLVVDHGDSKKCADGDQVVLHWIKGSGRNAATPRYFSGAEEINAGQITTFGEYAVVSENRITVIPFVDPELANVFSILGCALLTSYGTLLHVIGTKFLSKILVLGGGGLGQATIFMANAISKCDIVLVEPNSARKTYCQKLGAQTTFESIENLDKNLCFSSVIDTTGVPKVIEGAYPLLENPGVMALVGVTPSGEKIAVDPMPLHYGREIKGVYGGNSVPEIDLPRIIESIRKSGRHSILRFDEYKLSQINEAIDSLKSGYVVGRAVLNFVN